MTGFSGGCAPLSERASGVLRRTSRTRCRTALLTSARAGTRFPTQRRSHGSEGCFVSYLYSSPYPAQCQRDVRHTEIRKLFCAFGTARNLSAPGNETATPEKRGSHMRVPILPFPEGCDTIWKGVRLSHFLAFSRGRARRISSSGQKERNPTLR